MLRTQGEEVASPRLLPALEAAHGQRDGKPLPEGRKKHHADDKPIHPQQAHNHRQKSRIIPMPMFMAVLTVEFSLDGNDNLKAKRRVANSLKQKTRNKFNVAIAEAGPEDSLTRLRLAVASISNSETHLRSRMDKCALMMEAVCPEEMVDSQVEIYAAD